MSNLADLMGYVGPKAEAFVHDKRLLTAIMGPYGSAKTTSCIRKIVFESPLWMEPQADGVRRLRWCVVRDTYAQLETNVLNSWFGWFPKTKANWNGRTMCQTLRYELLDAATGALMPVELEIYFRAMGDQKAEDVLKGMELTGLWLNEADTLSMQVWLFGFGRTGRYPSKKDGGCAWRGAIFDFNAPDIDNWTYELLVDGNLGLSPEQERDMRAVLGDRFGIGFYRQPGGLSADPKPENIDNLPEGYYEGLAMAFAAQPGHLRRFVHNEFGMLRNGQVVFPEFNDQIHMANERLMPVPDIPLVCGVDGGTTPALVIGQQVGSQLRILDELVIYDPETDNDLEHLGAKSFGDLGRDLLNVSYPKCRFGIGFFDPACEWGDDDDALTWLERFKGNFGGKWKSGGEAGNRLEPRLQAVRDRLTRMPGGRPSILISPTCKMLRRGFGGGYVIERVKTSAGGRFRDKPSKNDFSHVQDALQYLCLGLAQNARVLDDMDRASRDRRAAPPNVTYGGGYFSPNRAGGQ